MLWKPFWGGRSPRGGCHELDPAGHAYGPTGIHHDRLRTVRPYPFQVDLTEVTRL